MRKLEKAIRVSEMHAKYGPIQREAFRKMHQQLTPSSVIVVQDFTRHYPYTNGISNPVIDMVAVMIFLDSNGLETIQHMHILSKQHKNNQQFVANAWLHILAPMLVKYERWDI